ncbi:MAG: hypothetical protein KDN19_15730 [Verrucomicrobiae bacterium]|nr:hypothetical protein [Verrucomicrobiae bacterium]
MCAKAHHRIAEGTILPHGSFHPRFHCFADPVEGNDEESVVLDAEKERGRVKVFHPGWLQGAKKSELRPMGFTLPEGKSTELRAIVVNHLHEGDLEVSPTVSGAVPKGNVRLD